VQVAVEQSNSSAAFDEDGSRCVWAGHHSAGEYSSSHRKPI